MERPPFAGQEYEAFELLVGPRMTDGYPLTILRSPAGEANGLCWLDPATPDVRDALQRIESGGADESFLVGFGCRLFDALFPRPIAAIYRASLALARGQGKGLRVRLRLEPQELAALPWEYLCDSEEDCFLAISPETPLVRYVPMPYPCRPTSVRPPLRVLVVLSSPVDAAPLDIEQERELIHEALDEWIDSGTVQLQFLGRGLTAEICESMRAFRPHVFHFVGHGQHYGNESYVVLEDEEGRSQPVGSRTFREFFLGIADTRLAILNACQSATTSSTRPLVGLAPRLLQRNLSAVVAMRAPIADQTALIFSREFYRSLALGYPVERAMAEARKTILLETGGEGQEWGIPVLFLRAQEGWLFEVVEEVETKPEVTPPPEAITPPPAEGFVDREAELAYFGEKLVTVHLAAISGMPGVGKTSLASVLAGRVGDPGKTFWHPFHEGEGIEEVIWKLAGFLYWQGREDPWRMLQGAQQSGGQPPPPAVMFDYLLQELRGRGFLLCLDDLDLVEEDPSLTEFLERMRPALEQDDIRLIVTSQRTPSFLWSDDTEALGGLSLEDTSQFLAQHGLPVIEVDEGMVYRTDELREEEKLITPDTVATLHERTGGNPTFLTLAVNALKRTSGPLALLARLSRVEDVEVEQFLMEEIDKRLDEEERAAMAAVAVLLGYSGTRDVVEAVLGGRNVRRTLRELRERHLLNVSEGEAGREYSLNTLVRYYFYDSLSRRERQAMHHRAGEYYTVEEADLLKAVLHLERAGEGDQAAELATTNLQALINRGQARSLYLLLDQLAEKPLSPSVQSSVHEACGDLQYLAGKLDEAIGQYGAAGESASDAPTQARLHRKLGEVHMRRGEYDQALDCLARGRALLPGIDMASGEEARLAVVYGTIMLLLGRYGEASTAAQTALDHLPGASAASQAAADLHDVLGKVHFYQGQMDGSLAHFQAALELRRDSDDPRGTLKSHSNLAVVYGQQNRYAEALRANEAALEVAEFIGDAIARAKLYNNMAVDAQDQGAHEQALEYNNRSLELYEKMGSIREVSVAHHNLGEVYRRQEQYDLAEEHLSQAIALAEQVGDQSGLVMGIGVLAQVYLAQGRVAEALARCQHALHLAERIDDRIWRPSGLRLLGCIYRQQCEWEKARSAYDEACQLWREREAMGDLADTLLHWARMERHAGRLFEAGERCAEAVALAAQLGADDLREEATALQSELAANGETRGRER